MSTLQRLPLLFPLLLACNVLNPNADTPETGGANVNDRSAGGEPGEVLLTGAMKLAPSGRYAVMQRNDVTLVFDTQTKKHTELPDQLSRVVFASQKDVAFAARGDGTLVAIDLASAKALWSARPISSSISLLRLGAEDSVLLVADAEKILLLDARDGTTRASAVLGSAATAAAFSSAGTKAIVVGQTAWKDHKPATPLLLVDLASGANSRIEIPNCEAPISILPDSRRAFLSPTFCEEDRASNPNADWTNPDPVSVIDLDADGLHFVKNLPGFGPVALDHDAARVVAYLDTKRMDPSMFADASQVPNANGSEYHLMVIDAKSLAFTLSPIGDALPRFAMSRDGSGLLVDASIKIKTRVKAKASGSFSIGPEGFSGEIGASVHVFQENAPFGYFDLATRKFTPFSGSQAGLDRFVQLADDKTVVTLEKRKDGLGGNPFIIDLEKKTTAPLSGNYGSGIRDIGLLPDGKTILLRFRLPADTKNGKLFSKEAACFSLDAKTCLDGGYIEYEASTPFADAPSTNDCPGYHDCW